MPIMKANIGF